MAILQQKSSYHKEKKKSANDYLTQTKRKLQLKYVFFSSKINLLKSIYKLKGEMTMEFMLLAGGLVIILIAVVVAVVSSVVSAVAAEQDDESSNV